MPGARVPRGRDDEGEPGDMRGGQPGTRSGNSARSGLDQIVELLGYGIVPASGEEQVQQAVGVGLEELVADGLGRDDAASGRSLPSTSKQARTRSSRPHAAYVQSACGTIPCPA